jgi:hypothetical protein
MKTRSFFATYIFSVLAVAAFGIALAIITTIVLFFGSFAMDAPGSPATPGVMLVAKALGVIATVYAWPAQMLLWVVIRQPLINVVVSYIVAPVLWGLPVAWLWRKRARKTAITHVGT